MKNGFCYFFKQKYEIRNTNENKRKPTVFSILVLESQSLSQMHELSAVLKILAP
jgi:hypothetical protein